MTFDVTTTAAPIIEVGYPQRSMPCAFSEWRTTEVATLARLYPSGGASAVHAALQGRTLAAIRGKAASMKIKCLRGSTTGLRFARRYPQSDHIDNAIREGYMHATKKGDMNALAARIGRPAWWVQKRAAGLGVTRNVRTRLDCWQAKELEILEAWAACTPKIIAKKLRRSGFARTETAVGVKLKRMQFDREDPDLWSATSLAPLLGVNPATVADWVERRGLPATRETWGPNGRLLIRRKALRGWIASHQRYIDLRRVDQTWFMDLVFGGA